MLDLSGNDFEILPSSFSKLKNLQELFLNDDKNFQFNKSIQILSRLPNLKSLHVDNDNLKKLPQKITLLTHLEKLYLNNNHFKAIPVEIKGLRNLTYVDFHHNDYKPKLDQTLNFGNGIRINF